MSKETKYVASWFSLMQLTGEEHKITYLIHIIVAAIACTTFILTYNNLSQKQHLTFSIWGILDRQVKSFRDKLSLQVNLNSVKKQKTTQTLDK